MTVYRIERKKYLEATLQGKGAALNSRARWNSLFTPMVYTAESRAMAYLEYTVHATESTLLIGDRLLVEIEIPNHLEIAAIEAKQLPRGWDQKPPTTLTQRIGDAFFLQSDVPVLKVPSAIIPEEHNFLINPAHPLSADICIKSHRPLNFDSRFSKPT